MAAAEDAFDSWLSNKLISINPDTDTEIFVQYIRSILESEDDDTLETLRGILQEISVYVHFIAHFVVTCNATSRRGVVEDRTRCLIQPKSTNLRFLLKLLKLC